MSIPSGQRRRVRAAAVAGAATMAIAALAACSSSGGGGSTSAATAAGTSAAATSAAATSAAEHHRRRHDRRRNQRRRHQRRRNQRCQHQRRRNQRLQHQRRRWRGLRVPGGPTVERVDDHRVGGLPTESRPPTRSRRPIRTRRSTWSPMTARRMARTRSRPRSACSTMPGSGWPDVVFSTQNNDAAWASQPANGQQAFAAVLNQGLVPQDVLSGFAQGSAGPVHGGRQGVLPAQRPCAGRAVVQPVAHEPVRLLRSQDVGGVPVAECEGGHGASGLHHRSRRRHLDARGVHVGQRVRRQPDHRTPLGDRRCDQRQLPTGGAAHRCWVWPTRVSLP